jgi:transposase InsO family protein
MPINPALTHRLVQIAEVAAAAPSGGKQAIYSAACAELSISPATLHRYLRQVTVKPTRKQRSDAGDVWADREECIALSAILMTSQRKTGKRLLSITQAVEIGRANAEFKLERICPDSGELIRLSDSAISRALRHYGLHPDQLNRPVPAMELRSLHPNHVWQIDASLCVLYYLTNDDGRESGLQVMESDKFYKNKPKNFRRIESDRVWSYEATDHYSGAIMLNYVMGAESGTNLTESFIGFIQKREGDPVHGVPLVLQMDKGSANTAGLFTNLARRLKIDLQPHSAGNARATGQVENARNIIERSFESTLRLKPVANLAELNEKAQRWARWYNASQIHSRHGKTRSDVWMTIAQEQLRIAPSLEICQELLTQAPELRDVSVHLTVKFKGAEYDVSGVPGVMVKEKLSITTNPYEHDAVLVLLKDANGHELLHTAAKVMRNEAGFREDANVIGEDFGRMADTQLETHRKEVQRVAYEAQTDEEADAKRKAGVIPFGGRIDPGKVIEQTPERIFIPKRGEELAVNVTTASSSAEAKILKGFELARALADLGIEMSRERNALVAQLYPEGVPEDELPALQARLQVRAGLRVVAGGGA